MLIFRYIFQKLLIIILIICLVFEYPFSLKSVFNKSAGTENTKGLSNGSPWIDSDLPENVNISSIKEPREDFHLYATKDLILRKKYVEGYSVWNYYAEATSEVDDRAMKLLEDREAAGHEAELVYDIYDLLIDWDTRDKNGLEDIRKLTEPVLDAGSLDELTEYLMTEDALIFLVNFISITVDNSLRNSDQYVVYIEPESLLLDDPAEYGERTEYGDMTAAYNEKMFTYLAKRLGIKKSEAEKMLDRAYDLEKRMAGTMFTSEEKMRDDYIEKADNEMSFAELEKLSVNFPLADLVEAQNLKYDEYYIVTEPDYIEFLNEIYTDSNLESIKSLIYINALLDLSGYTDREASEFESDTSNECYGASYWYTDEETAYYSAKKLLSEPLQKIYVEKYGSEEDREKLEKLSRDVIDCYREMLYENEWASRETIDYAIEKLDAIKLRVAYPDKWTDYSDLSLKDCSLLRAVERITMFYHLLDCGHAGKKAENECWALSNDTLECNAYYSSSENTIYICLGMMEEPFYYDNMSKEELYASIAGFWVGHEISHSFDAIGAKYDAEGNLRDWWSENDKAEFRSRIDKMDKYLDTIVPFEGYHVNGKSIDTEMLADITGMQCALRMASKDKDFDYEDFFRKFASLNVSISLYSEELSTLLQDQHPLSYLRTNVVVQQFDEFYETYGVEEGDTMYLAPGNRIAVW